MAHTVNHGTYASTDLRSIFDEAINSNVRLTQRITDVKNESNIFLCKVLRIYSYKDIALVKILNNGSEVIAHLTHDIMDSNMSLLGMNRGSVKSDSTNGTYVIPFDDVYGIVAKVRWDDINDEYCFISCINLHDNDGFKTVVGDGEILLSVGNSKISITSERINIMTPKLFVNGLPYDAPELTNYYSKTESDVTSIDLDNRLKLISKRLDSLVESNNLIEEDNDDDGEG